MPMCGFNNKMIKGLRDFTEGLVEHGLVFRAEKNGETASQAIQREISDMTRFLCELQRIDDACKQVLTSGLVRYCMGFYLLMRKNDEKEYVQIVDRLMQYFHEMDQKYYGELEGKPDDMEELAKYLNGLSL